MNTTADREVLNIDDLLTRLRQVAPDRSLDQLEPLVWTRITAERRGQSPSWGRRASIAAAALVVGAAAGGAAAARSTSGFALFSPHAELAPSTLLGFTE